MNATELFKAFLECEQLTWDHNNTGCESRADVMAEIAIESGFEPEKIWIRNGTGVDSFFGIYLNKSKTELVYCKYHVAIILTIDNKRLVFDPSFFDKPVDTDTWKTYLTRYSKEYDKGCYVTESDWRYFYYPEQMNFQREEALKNRERILKLSRDFSDPTVYAGVLAKARGEWIDQMAMDDPENFEKINSIPRTGKLGLWLFNDQKTDDLVDWLNGYDYYFGIPTVNILDNIDFTERLAVLNMKKHYWLYMYELFKVLNYRKYSLLDDITEDQHQLFHLIWYSQDDDDHEIMANAWWFGRNSHEDWQRFNIDYKSLLEKHGHI